MKKKARIVAESTPLSWRDFRLGFRERENLVSGHRDARYSSHQSVTSLLPHDSTPVSSCISFRGTRPRRLRDAAIDESSHGVNVLSKNHPRSRARSHDFHRRWLRLRLRRHGPSRCKRVHRSESFYTSLAPLPPPLLLLPRTPRHPATVFTTKDYSSLLPYPILSCPVQRRRPLHARIRIARAHARPGYTHRNICRNTQTQRAYLRIIRAHSPTAPPGGARISLCPLIKRVPCTCTHVYSVYTRRKQ